MTNNELMMAELSINCAEAIEVANELRDEKETFRDFHDDVEDVRHFRRIINTLRLGKKSAATLKTFDEELEDLVKERRKMLKAGARDYTRVTNTAMALLANVFECIAIFTYNWVSEGNDIEELDKLVSISDHDNVEIFIGQGGCML